MSSDASAISAKDMTFSICSFEIRGPISVFGSKGSPITKFLALSTILFLNSFAIGFSTRILDPAKHCCPLFENIATIAASNARSISASENIIFADLPPSSVTIFLSVLPDSAPITLPVSVPPVKAITSMFSFCVIAAPVTAPLPLTMFITPSGRPAFFSRFMNGTNPSGVSSDGFKTQLFPNAIAPAIFIVANAIGAFHGAINPATPIGSLLT